jgi:hypothetical protein
MTWSWRERWTCGKLSCRRRVWMGGVTVTLGWVGGRKAGRQRRCVCMARGRADRPGVILPIHRTGACRYRFRVWRRRRIHWSSWVGHKRLLLVDGGRCGCGRRGRCLRLLLRGKESLHRLLVSCVLSKRLDQGGVEQKTGVKVGARVKRLSCKGPPRCASAS